MKVGIVYPIPFGDDGVVGGGERYAWELARTLAKAVDTVFVTTGRERRTAWADGLRVETHPWRTLLRGLRMNPLSVGFLRSLVGVDVIHCVAYSTVLTDLCVFFARLTRKKVFITDVGGGGNLTLASRVDVAARANGLLLLSEYASRTFRSRSRRRRVIYGGVDTARFQPSSVPRERKVLFVGRLLPHKGINYLIDAVDADTPLTVIGRPYHPAYLDELRRLAAGKRVTFVTDASDARIIAEYRSSAAVVMPSVYTTVEGAQTTVPELLGLALIEGMACGTPGIATDVGSLPEIVEHGVSGCIVPPNDSAALGAALQSVIDDPVRVEAMGQAACERVLARFTWPAAAERCLAAYREL